MASLRQRPPDWVRRSHCSSVTYSRTRFPFLEANQSAGNTYRPILGCCASYARARSAKPYADLPNFRLRSRIRRSKPTRRPKADPKPFHTDRILAPGGKGMAGLDRRLEYRYGPAFRAVDPHGPSRNLQIRVSSVAVAGIGDHRSRADVGAREHPTPMLRDSYSGSEPEIPLWAVDRGTLRSLRAAVSAVPSTNPRRHFRTCECARRPQRCVRRAVGRRPG
jgi:hypothetical protein